MATAILMPRQGQSVESCILTAWSVKPGDRVAEGQPVAQIETDKATFEVPAPAAGTVLELFFPEGADIPVLTHIAAVGEPGEDVSALRPGASAAGATPTAPYPTNSAPPASSSPAPAPAPDTRHLTPETSASSPRARKAAAATGLDAAALAGSGPGGRVIERDVLAAAAQLPRMSPAARESMAAGKGHAPATGSGPGGLVLTSDLTPETRHLKPDVQPPATIPLKGIRKIVAERMRQSLASTAQLTLNASFDATVLQSFRARAKAHAESLGLPKYTINDLICFAVVKTLARHPELNAHFLGDRIVQHGSVHLGIAVDTPRGLMVPVVRDAQALGVTHLAAAIKARAEECQKGSINPDLLSGGTFTITNLGVFGIESFTPVLNTPEVAILGVGGLSLKPVRKDGAVVFVDSISLSLTIDHQAVDGAPAARFLQDLVKTLENVDLILAR